MVQTEVKEMVRIPLSVTLPRECVEWLDRKAEARTYANRSHVIDVLILEAMKGSV